ncbi:MAG: hypothetical protein AVDCRST_MAG95-3503 [uncultured Adhaeribacter sp.]|uniref:DUF4905 domain-containing protein n=1 Tax=uncultured Adhaeribacter sp. TaxID=448109 RepID=A0A6J4JPU5_9BACT|nr:MAG: hypothetical protein AVDCRST_MAG95-3503 [uncultured Adhaeribacter sp.]
MNQERNSLSHLTAHLQFLIDFGVPIWQMRPGGPEKMLALEIRDGDRLQTEFVVVDVAAGRLVGAPYRAPENWWIGLEDLQHRQIYLHGFADRRVGSHRGLTAIDIDTGQIRWQQEQGVYFGLVAPQQLIVRSDPGQGNEYTLLDSQTGQIVETGISPDRAHTKVAAYAAQRAGATHYPVHHPESSAHFALLGQFISSQTGQLPAGAIDYLETGTFFVVAYYLPTPGGKLKHTLAVYATQDGALLLQVELAAAGAGVVTGSFFMMQETLIFVQEQHTLLGYRFK